MGKTVFFGPFIGEFGWELLFWQGWVNTVCREYYADHEKIVAGYPGRKPFYPDADSYWAHPDWFCKIQISQRNYMTDFWKNGFPTSVALKYDKRFKLFKKKVWIEEKVKSVDSEPIVSKLLNHYKSKLPDDTIFYVPYLENYYTPKNLRFGVRWPEKPSKNEDFELMPIKFEYQDFKQIIPTTEGISEAAKILPKNQKIIAIFPRHRNIRRADKNWEKSQYDVLINLIKENFPEYGIGIFGEPNGAYYADGVPNGCYDFINVNYKVRMDTQVAALQHTSLAIGSMSGAVLFALACGSPVLTWGHKDEQTRYHQENFLSSPLVYFPDMSISVDEVFQLITGMLTKKLQLPNKDDYSIKELLGRVPFRYRMDQILRVVRRIKKLFL